MLVMARVIEKEQGDVDRALEMNRADPRDRRAATSRRSTRSSGSTSARRVRRAARIYEKKLELSSDSDERIAIQSKIGQLYEDEVKDDDKAIAAYQAILEAAGDEPSALRSLDRIYVRNAKWKELADVLGRQLTRSMIWRPDDDKAAHVELKYRLGQVREQHLGDVEGAIDMYRDILDLEPTHAKARAALESRLTATRQHQLTSAGILEPIYEQLEEWAPLVGVHEIQLAAETDAAARASLLAPHRRAAAHEARRRREGVRRLRARVPRGSVDRGAQGAARGARRAARRRLGQAGQAVRRGAREGQARGRWNRTSRTSSRPRSRGSYEERLGNSEKAIEYFRRALAIESGRPRPRSPRSSDLHARRA